MKVYRVNSVRPGFILTDIHASGGEPERIAAELKYTMPLQRGGTAEEVANAILRGGASEGATHTTGALT